MLTLNQVRLVLRIADAYGFEIDRERLPEVLGGDRRRASASARSPGRRSGIVPFVGWAVKGAVAYAATRALGEAAVRYFERRAPVTRVAGERVRFPAIGRAWRSVVRAAGPCPSDRLPSIAAVSDRREHQMVDKREAEELLMIEEADAWFEYLEATRNQSETRYREVEPWAWARLNQRLRAIRTRRAKLRPAAA